MNISYTITENMSQSIKSLWLARRQVKQIIKITRAKSNIDINPYLTVSEKQSFKMNKNVYPFIFYIATFLL